MPRITRATVTSWVLVSFLVAYTGPFGTYAMGFGRRLLYWSLVVVCSSLISHVSAALAGRIVGKRSSLLTDFLTVVLMTLLFSPVLWGITRGLLGGGPGLIPAIWVFAQFVAIITAVITSARRTIPGLARGSHRRARETPEPEPDVGLDLGAEPGPPRLVRRLPKDFQGPILRLAVNDHFVDVVTPRMTHRLRLRLADAVDEMDTVAGFCTHRSHWVARQAVEGVERQAGRIMLRLSNGDHVPVSRTYRPRLEAAGIF